MKEFFEVFNAALSGFPVVLGKILIDGVSAFFGALLATIVAPKVTGVPFGRGDAMGHFIVCWLTGGFVGSGIVVPVVQSVAKLPEYLICFLTSGSGWWFWTKLVPKKQEEYLNKKPDAGTETPPDNQS